MPKPAVFTATLTALLVTESGDHFLTRRVDELPFTLDGIPGDRHFGPTRGADSRTPQYPRGTPIRNTRQVSILSVEELHETAALLGVPAVLPDWLGGNLLLSGLPRLTLLPAGTRLTFPGEAVVVVQDENFPCSGPANELQRRYPEREKLAAAFLKAAMHRRGVVGWVERAGIARSGDLVKVEVPPLPAYYQ